MRVAGPGRPKAPTFTTNNYLYSKGPFIRDGVGALESISHCIPQVSSLCPSRGQIEGESTFISFQYILGNARPDSKPEAFSIKLNGVSLIVIC